MPYFVFVNEDGSHRVQSGWDEDDVVDELVWLETQ